MTIAEATGSVIDVNFGFVKPASVGDYTWMDVNRDGLQDADEPALPGVTVTLTRADGSAVTDASGNPVAAVTTDANGKYVFENLLPGDYKVSIDPETLKTAEPLLDVLTHDPSGDVASKTVVSEEVKADKEKLADASS